MFTGIIEGLGTVRSIGMAGGGKRLTIESDVALTETAIGDSIAVNGACLTVVTISNRRFAADVSPETLSKTTLGQVKMGERVNLERALKLGARLDGHLVSGHIDGLGTIADTSVDSNAIRITIDVSADLARYMIQKGSVAVDGVSLTINRCDTQSFEVSIIPHTAKLTTVGLKHKGDRVNIETDMIAKYVERFVAPASQSPGAAEPSSKGDIDMKLLAKTGFI